VASAATNWTAPTCVALVAHVSSALAVNATKPAPRSSVCGTTFSPAAKRRPFLAVVVLDVRRKGIEWRRWKKTSVETWGPTMIDEPCDGCSNRATHALCDACATEDIERLEKERDEARAAVADAYQRGAEDMREQVASLFDGGAGIPGLAKVHGFRDFIRDLPIPEEK
jgi:hypothetical protein